MKRLTTTLALAAALGVCSMASANDTNPRKQSFERSTDQLDELVLKAKDGRITQEQLRKQRRRVEARLDHELSSAAVELKPGELREVTVARAEMNQSIITSQEFEFFGAEDRPEWGWYPSRDVASTGSVLTVGTDGRANYSALH